MWAAFGLRRNVAPIRTICGFRTCSTLRVRVWETGVPPPARSTGGALEMARGWSDNPAALFRAEGTTPPRAWLARRGGQGGCTPAEQREWRRSGRGSAAPPGRGRRAPGAAVRSPARWAVQVGAESGRRGLRTLRLHVACGSVGLGLRAADLPFGGGGGGGGGAGGPRRGRWRATRGGARGGAQGGATGGGSRAHACARSRQCARAACWPCVMRARRDTRAPARITHGQQPARACACMPAQPVAMRYARARACPRARRRFLRVRARCQQKWP